MTEIYPLREHTRGERVAVHKFGFDKEPDIPEMSERIGIRAAHIADLARDLFAAEQALVVDNGHETEAPE